VTAEDKGRMLQAEDLAETILFVARSRPAVQRGFEVPLS
jgi:NADP-dependent 3-hydroxy acid dehydrogenase YdfG